MSPLGSNEITVDGVADFLKKIRLSQYVDKFIENGIDGELLENMNLQVLRALDVQSPLHQMKIIHLFSRQLRGTDAKYSNAHLSQFLQKNDLHECILVLKEHEIDGDMILEVDNTLMESVLEEIGISPLDSLKIFTYYMQ